MCRLQLSFRGNPHPTEQPQAGAAGLSGTGEPGPGIAFDRDFNQGATLTHAFQPVAQPPFQFKIETLTQQLQLAQSEVERTSSELATKVEEFAKYRRSRHSELAQLQAANDTLTQTQARAESSLKALEAAHTSQTHQLTQALAQVQDLKGALAEQEATFAAEVGGLKRLVAMMEERETQQKVLVESIEAQWAGVGERADRRELALKDEVERERRLREDAERRVDQMQKVLEKMDRGELPALGGGLGPFSPGTPGRGGPSEQGMMGLSPTVAMASRAQRSGKTFTEVYADYIKLQEDFARKSLEYDQMERTLTQVLGQIEERVCMPLSLSVSILTICRLLHLPSNARNTTAQ